MISKMKDEVKGKIISGIFGSKSKTYSLVFMNDEEINKTKGVNKNVVKNIRHKGYVDVCLIKILLGIMWRGFKVSYVKLELMMFEKKIILFRW